MLQFASTEGANSHERSGHHHCTVFLKPSGESLSHFTRWRAEGASA
jgi:hypothetical protein